MKYDNIHWKMNNLISYNKTFNFAVSGRGPGKSTDISRYLYKQYEKGYMFVLIRRLITDCTEVYINDFVEGINRFLDVPFEIKYNKSELGKGLCDVYIAGNLDRPFFRIIALSNPRYRLKGQVLKAPLSWIFFDEYKISREEKYLKGEFDKFKELYATLCRYGPKDENGETTAPRVIFAGNNYSLTDPYVAGLKIPVNKIKPGIILADKNFAFEDIKINEELRRLLIKQNPLFDFGQDDAYTKYALDGISVSDQRIKILEKQPEKYRLQFVFSIENKLLGIFYNANDWFRPGEDVYWVTVLNGYDSKNRNIACFDYDSLVEGTYLISNEDRITFNYLKNCFRYRKITFKSITEGYLFEQIYDNI